MNQETTKQKPVMEAVCRPISDSPVIVVPCKAVLTVTYSIDISSTNSPFQIPYAVAVNGKVLPEYLEQSKKAIWTPTAKDKTGKVIPAVPAVITVPAQAGDTVVLYLNSDAAPAWRTTPLYSVTLGNRPAIVQIIEKLGKLQDRAIPALKTGTLGDKDEYTASLTGAIWMSASHVYRSSEAETHMPEGTRPEVLQAIKRIYDGLGLATLKIEGSARGERLAFTLVVVFEDSDNPKQNISNFNLLSDGLTRVHPAGYAALFNSAIDSGVEKIVVTSCWRPLLGSIVHRLGMGLDVNYAGTVRLNREELKTGKPKSKDSDENVSEEEVRLFKLLEQSQGELNKAENEARRLAKSPNLEAKVTVDEKVKNTTIRRNKDYETWDSERNKHEPEKVKAFRSTLLKCTCVSQLFDPWYMYANTSATGAPNMQAKGNEKLHANHLHITVRDRNIVNL